MSISFDWNFEEEESEFSSPLDQGAASPERRPHWLRRSVVALVLFVVIGLSARAWAKNRLDAVGKVEAELRGSVELELKAIADGDVELFAARQAPSDHSWRARQVARYIYNCTEFAPVPGLRPADHPFEIKKIHLSGGTGRVELTRWFQPPTSPPPEQPAPGADQPTDEPTTLLPFHVTWFYHLGDDGAWYHVAPPGNYWGAPYSWYGSRLIIRASEVEAQLLDPIARDLAGLVVRGCRLLDCSKDTRYNLSFEDVPFPLLDEDRWVLPALYLTGLPEDEVARAVWKRALERWLVGALVQAQVERQGLTNRLVYRQLVARLQAELGLLEPVSPDVERLTEALAEGKNHSRQGLWQAEYAPDDPDGMRLLEAEVAAMLQVLETQVGSKGLFELLPALPRHERLDPYLAAHYRLDPNDLEGAWSTYLSELTGVPVTPEPILLVHRRTDEQTLEVSALVTPSVPPGNQIALTCDNQIWVGNLDGSNMVPLTDGDQQFGGVRWSPDGRWLLTTWQHSVTHRQGELYLLAADGGEGRLLTYDPVPSVWSAGWGPDGRTAYYGHQVEPNADGTTVEIWAIDVETGQERPLPGVPMWSPDGEHFFYSTWSPGDTAGRVWVAEGDWENVHQITDQVVGWPAAIWSPDGSKLALSLDDEDANRRAVAIYDLATERLTPLVTLTDLRAAVLSFEGDVPLDDARPVNWADVPFLYLWGQGWSADGKHLLVSIAGERDEWLPQGLVAQVVVSRDGTPPRVLAFTEYGGAFGTSWSPTDPNLLTLAWQSGGRVNNYLFDLQSGPIYTATESWNATWSPDGAWAAFGGPNQVTIVDQEGRAHSILRHDNFCSVPVWNPTADLTPSDPECAAGLALRMTPQDVYHADGALLLHVHNGGDQAVKNLPARVADAAGDSSLIVGLGSVPACGSLLVRIAIRDWTSPLTITLNPPEEPLALPEDDYEDNRVVVTLDQ